MSVDWLVDWSGWNWHGWEALVAIGTLVLAGMTFVLALVTRKLAKETATVAGETRDLAIETARTAEADQESLAAAIRPLLVPLRDLAPPLRAPQPEDYEPVFYGLVNVYQSYNVWPTEVDVRHIEEGEPGTILSFPIRNVGAGAAFITKVRVRPHGQAWSDTGKPIDQVVPVGESTRVLWRSGESVTATGFFAEVRYTDAKGKSELATRLSMMPQPGASTPAIVGVQVCDVQLIDATVLVESGWWPEGA